MCIGPLAAPRQATPPPPPPPVPPPPIPQAVVPTNRSRQRRTLAGGRSQNRTLLSGVLTPSNSPGISLLG